MPDDIKEDVVWEATVDGHTWLAKVVGMESNEYRGILTVTRVSDDKEILREEVGLSYGAKFGPDVDDVNLWAQMVIGAIDHFEAQNPNKDTDDSGA